MKLSVAAALAASAAGLDNGLLRTPPMGMNSWTAVGTGVSAQFLLDTAAFFASSGMQAAGYTFVNTDDGWDLGARDPTTGRILPDTSKFPGGISNLTSLLHARGFAFGIYAAASSVVCSGRPGSLYREVLDAQTFADWGVDYVKYDNCGEYALGLARFTVFADAVNATGRPMAISTEPFSIFPTPLHAQFSNLWRTGNDINANYGTIVNRADLNAKWAPFTGPGAWADPDMLQINNGGLKDNEARVQFGLWAVSKSPLLLGTDVTKLSKAQIDIVTAPGVIAVNQDAMGVQARKLAANGTLAPRYVGIAPCSHTLTGAGSTTPGDNGVTAAGMVWSLQPLNTTTGLHAVVHNATGRCLATQPYLNYAQPVPVLLPCDLAGDATQTWWLPNVTTVGGIVNVALNAALTVGDSTVYGSVHGNDPQLLLDAAYGISNLTFTPFAPEPPCSNRGCDNYVPQQSWYASPSSGRIQLSMFSANIYRCFEGSCYELTSHLPATQHYCLAEVASISNNGIFENIGGVHVWGGPLSGGAFVMALDNRDGSNTLSGEARWAWLEAPGVGDSTSMCVRELFSDTQLGVFTGGITVPVPSHDIAVLRLVPGATSC